MAETSMPSIIIMYLGSNYRRRLDFIAQLKMVLPTVTIIALSTSHDETFLADVAKAGVTATVSPWPLEAALELILTTIS